MGVHRNFYRGIFFPGGISIEHTKPKKGIQSPKRLNKKIKEIITNFLIEGGKHPNAPPSLRDIYDDRFKNDFERGR